MTHPVYPLVIPLPDGTEARVRITHIVEVNDKGEETLTQLVQSPPQYERRDGTTVDLDVQIPDDLAAAGWYWHGSTLALDGGLLRIGTETYPPPGWPAPQGTCFDIARRYEVKHSELEAARLARQTPATRVRRLVPKQPAGASVVEQLAMELV